MTATATRPAAITPSLKAVAAQLEATHVQFASVGTFLAKFVKESRTWQTLPVRPDGSLFHTDWVTDRFFNPQSDDVVFVKTDSSAARRVKLNKTQSVSSAVRRQCWRDFSSDVRRGLAERGITPKAGNSFKNISGNGYSFQPFVVGESDLKFEYPGRRKQDDRIVAYCYFFHLGINVNMLAFRGDGANKIRYSVSYLPQGIDGALVSTFQSDIEFETLNELIDFVVSTRTAIYS